MAFDVGELFAGISLDDAKYQAGLRKVKADGEAVERKGIKPKVDIDTTAAQSKLGRLGALIDQNSAKLRNVGRDMTMMVSAPMAAAGTASIILAGNLEQASIAFETLLGSKSEADAFLESMEQFAKATPFQFTDLVEQSKRLMAYGFTAEQILPVLTSVGDATAALGSGAEGIENITRAIGQIQAKGRVQAEEMRQLAEAGVPAWQMLAESMHMSVQQVMKEVEQGSVSADAAITTILEGMNERYGGLMEKQSKTILGQFSNLMDELKMTAAEFGLEMKPFLEPVLDVFRGMLSALGSIPGPLKAVIGILGGIAAVLGPALWALGAMADGVRALKDLWGFFRPAQVAADTAAVSANTAAVEANTLARGKNALTPPVGSSGVMPAAPQLAGGAAAGGLGTLGTAGAIGVIAGSAALTGGLIYYGLTYQQAPDSPNAANVTGGTAGVGRAGAASQAAYADDIRPKLDRNAEGIAHLNEVIDEINALRPTADAVGMTKVYEGKLKRLAEQYPEIAGQIHATAEKLREGAQEFETAAKAAKEAAAANREAIMAQLDNVQSLVDMIALATNAELQALQELPGGIASMMSELSGATARANADKMLKDRYKNGIDWSQVPDRVTGYASGGDFVTNGPELILVGDNPSGRERVTVTPSEAKSIGGDGLTLVLNVKNLYGTDSAALDRFANQVGNVLARKVRYANA